MTPDELAALHGACFDTPRPWSATEFSDLLASPLVFIVPVPHGFALGRVVADEAELLTLAIDPDARRAGYGRLALAGFETEAIARGAVTAFLEVAADNTAARALYEASGFGESGRRAGYYRRPDGSKTDAIVMAKPLKQA